MMSLYLHQANDGYPLTWCKCALIGVGHSLPHQPSDISILPNIAILILNNHHWCILAHQTTYILYLAINDLNVYYFQWSWLANTLNPYYEGNSPSNMISDDRFMFHTLQNWDFGADNTGNLMLWENSQATIKKATSLGKVK